LERRSDLDTGAPHISDASAVVPLYPTGWLHVEREDARATFAMPSPPTASETAHPYLAPVAAIAASWLGRQAFHAGAFEHRGAAWGVLGDKGDGKSSLLASLAQAGASVMADDLVVVDAGSVFAAPRCIDLRSDSAAALGIGTAIGEVGGRERFRVALGPAPSSLPLAGWVTLGWADEVAVASVPATERLPAILGSLALRVEPGAPSTMLDYAVRPMLRLYRPVDYKHAGSAAEALLAAVDRAR
jgi:hypothetical protein